MTFCGVAISRGPQRVLTYSVPENLQKTIELGRRVLVPLGRGNRRVTGYVVSLGEEPPDHSTKPIADVLDERPLFDADMLGLFEFVAGYYHAPLAEVIRTGLPGGLNVQDARVATVTELGRSRVSVDPLLARIARGAVPTKELGVSMARLVRLAETGLIELGYELARARAQARFVSVLSLTGAEPAKPLKAGAGPAVLLDLLRAEGQLEVPSLKGRVTNHGAAVRRLVAIGVARIDRTQSFRDPWHGVDIARDVAPQLTDQQRRAVEAITRSVDDARYDGFLLRGVTGSGKTEVYLHALEHALDRGKGGIVLVPEIALTPQLSGRFRARFGERVAVLHSGLSDGERLDQWQLIRAGERPVVVGARSAIFAPIPNLGLIVVDEEHETSFKQDETPRYHARDMALKRGHMAAIPVVLGSATPSLETVLNSKRGRLTRLELPGRIGQRPLPPVELIDLKDHPPVHPEAMLSRPLLEAITEVVSRKEQAIIFLNRRGFSNCLLCRVCGNVPRCVDCSVSLTWHKRQHRLSCHYCEFQRPMMTVCSECGAQDLQLLGAGTEQIEEVLAQELPGARVARMDRDTTRGRALDKLLTDFRRGDIDVLVGTQMVAKGHDFPNVTLVGVLLAEQSLKMQDFRAAERTFQLLTQVSGRAGRHKLPGKVLVQTYTPDDETLKLAMRHDLDAFVSRELRTREQRRFPPFNHVALVRIDAPKPATVWDAAGRIGVIVRKAGSRELDIIGPQLAPIERLRGRTRVMILLKTSDRAALHRVLALLDPTDTKLLAGARLAIDVDPVNLL